MGNFIEEFKRGQRGDSKGIPFGEGLEKLTSDLNGIQRGRIYGVGGPEKSGKSTFTDYAFVIQPYLHSLKTGLKISWDYYSFEIDRISKEFDFAAFFMNHDYNVVNIRLPDGVTRKGESLIPLSPDYLRGYLLDDKENPIKIHEALKPLLEEVYEKRIVPLFGEYDRKGLVIKKGLINFKEGRENPTGVYKDILAEAEKEGVLLKDSYEKPYSYMPHDSSKVKIVIIDHIRKLKPERGWQMKQTIDKMSEYMVILRNLLGYTFVPILHTNRNLASTDKLSFYKGDIYPTSNDLKDSGNLGEDCNYLLMTFNPNDDQYNLKEHFGFKIKSTKGNVIFPNLRTIHLVSSRHCEFPLHYKVNMFGNFKKFEKIQ